MEQWLPKGGASSPPDGAFERFLTAAIATIITIMFSWRMLDEDKGKGDEEEPGRHKLGYSTPLSSSFASPYREGARVTAFSTRGQGSEVTQERVHRQQNEILAERPPSMSDRASSGHAVSAGVGYKPRNLRPSIRVPVDLPLCGDDACSTTDTDNILPGPSWAKSGAEKQQQHGHRPTAIRPDSLPRHVGSFTSFSEDQNEGDFDSRPEHFSLSKNDSNGLDEDTHGDYVDITDSSLEDVEFFGVDDSSDLFLNLSGDSANSRDEYRHIVNNDNYRPFRVPNHVMDSRNFDDDGGDNFFDRHNQGNDFADDDAEPRELESYEQLFCCSALEPITEEDSDDLSTSDGDSSGGEAREYSPKDREVEYDLEFEERKRGLFSEGVVSDRLKAKPIYSVKTSSNFGSSSNTSSHFGSSSNTSDILASFNLPSLAEQSQRPISLGPLRGLDKQGARFAGVNSRRATRPDYQAVTGSGASGFTLPVVATRAVPAVSNALISQDFRVHSTTVSLTDNYLDYVRYHGSSVDRLSPPLVSLAVSKCSDSSGSDIFPAGERNLPSEDSNSVTSGGERGSCVQDRQEESRVTRTGVCSGPGRGGTVVVNCESYKENEFKPSSGQGLTSGLRPFPVRTKRPVSDGLVYVDKRRRSEEEEDAFFRDRIVSEGGGVAFGENVRGGKIRDEELVPDEGSSDLEVRSDSSFLSERFQSQVNSNTEETLSDTDCVDRGPASVSSVRPRDSAIFSPGVEVSCVRERLDKTGVKLDNSDNKREYDLENAAASGGALVRTNASSDAGDELVNSRSTKEGSVRLVRKMDGREQRVSDSFDRISDRSYVSVRKDTDDETEYEEEIVETFILPISHERKIFQTLQSVKDLLDQRTAARRSELIPRDDEDEVDEVSEGSCVTSMINVEGRDEVGFRGDDDWRSGYRQSYNAVARTDQDLKERLGFQLSLDEYKTEEYNTESGWPIVRYIEKERFYVDDNANEGMDFDRDVGGSGGDTREMFVDEDMSDGQHMRREMEVVAEEDEEEEHRRMNDEDGGVDDGDYEDGDEEWEEGGEEREDIHEGRGEGVARGVEKVKREEDEVYETPYYKYSTKEYDKYIQVETQDYKYRTNDYLHKPMEAAHMRHYTETTEDYMFVDFKQVSPPKSDPPPPPVEDAPMILTQRPPFQRSTSEDQFARLEPGDIKSPTVPEPPKTVAKEGISSDHQAMMPPRNKVLDIAGAQASGYTPESHSILLESPTVSHAHSAINSPGQFASFVAETSSDDVKYEDFVREMSFKNDTNVTQGQDESYTALTPDPDIAILSGNLATPYKQKDVFIFPKEELHGAVFSTFTGYATKNDTAQGKLSDSEARGEKRSEENEQKGEQEAPIKKPRLVRTSTAQDEEELLGFKPGFRRSSSVSLLDGSVGILNRSFEEASSNSFGLERMNSEPGGLNRIKSREDLSRSKSREAILVESPTVDYRYFPESPRKHYPPISFGEPVLGVVLESSMTAQEQPRTGSSSTDSAPTTPLSHPQGSKITPPPVVWTRVIPGSNFVEEKLSPSSDRASTATSTPPDMVDGGGTKLSPSSDRASTATSTPPDMVDGGGTKLSPSSDRASTATRTPPDMVDGGGTKLSPSSDRASTATSTPPDMVDGGRTKPLVSGNVIKEDLLDLDFADSEDSPDYVARVPPSTKSIPSVTLEKGIQSAIPTKSIPSITPTKSIPSVTPTKSIPSVTPTKSIPSVTPTKSIPSMIPTKSIPSVTPTKSIPSMIPTKSIPSMIPTKIIAPDIPTESISSISPLTLPSVTLSTASPSVTSTTLIPIATPTKSISAISQAKTLPTASPVPPSKTTSAISLTQPGPPVSPVKITSAISLTQPGPPISPNNHPVPSKRPNTAPPRPPLAPKPRTEVTTVSALETPPPSTPSATGNSSSPQLALSTTTLVHPAPTSIPLKPSQAFQQIVSPDMKITPISSPSKPPLAPKPRKSSASNVKAEAAPERLSPTFCIDRRETRIELASPELRRSDVIRKVEIGEAGEKISEDDVDYRDGKMEDDVDYRDGKMEDDVEKEESKSEEETGDDEESDEEEDEEEEEDEDEEEDEEIEVDEMEVSEENHVEEISDGENNFFKEQVSKVRDSGPVTDEGFLRESTSTTRLTSSTTSSDSAIILASPTASLSPVSPMVAVPSSTSSPGSTWAHSQFISGSPKRRSMKEIKKRYKQSYKSVLAEEPTTPPSPKVTPFVLPESLITPSRLKIIQSRNRFLSEQNLHNDPFAGEFAAHREAMAQATAPTTAPTRDRKYTPKMTKNANYRSHEQLEKIMYMINLKHGRSEGSLHKAHMDCLHDDCILSEKGRRELIDKALSIDNLHSDLYRQLQRFDSETDTDAGSLGDAFFPETNSDMFDLTFPFQGNSGRYLERPASMSELRHASDYTTISGAGSGYFDPPGSKGKGRFSNRQQQKSKSLCTLETNLDDVNFATSPTNANLQRVPSAHELRISKSLQKLNVPNWYKQSSLSKSGSCLLKYGSNSSMSSWAFSPSLISSPCTTPSTTSNVVIKSRVQLPTSSRNLRSPHFTTKSAPTTPSILSQSQDDMPSTASPVKLPSEKMRTKDKPKALMPIPIVPFDKIRAMFEKNKLDRKTQNPQKEDSPISHPSQPSQPSSVTKPQAQRPTMMNPSNKFIGNGDDVHDTKDIIPKVIVSPTDPNVKSILKRPTQEKRYSDIRESPEADNDVIISKSAATKPPESSPTMTLSQAPTLISPPHPTKQQPTMKPTIKEKPLPPEQKTSGELKPSQTAKDEKKQTSKEEKISPKKQKEKEQAPPVAKPKGFAFFKSLRTSSSSSTEEVKDKGRKSPIYKSHKPETSPSISPDSNPNPSSPSISPDSSYDSPDSFPASPVSRLPLDGKRSPPTVSTTSETARPKTSPYVNVAPGGPGGSTRITEPGPGVRPTLNLSASAERDDRAPRDARLESSKQPPRAAGMTRNTRSPESPEETNIDDSYDSSCKSEPVSPDSSFKSEPVSPESQADKKRSWFPKSKSKTPKSPEEPNKVSPIKSKTVPSQVESSKTSPKSKDSEPQSKFKIQELSDEPRRLRSPVDVPLREGSRLGPSQHDSDMSRTSESFSQDSRSITRDSDPDRSRDLDRSRDHDRSRDLDRSHDLDRSRDLDRSHDLDRSRDLDRSQDSYSSRSVERSREFERDYARDAKAPERRISVESDRSFPRGSDRPSEGYPSLERTSVRSGRDLESYPSLERTSVRSGRDLESYPSLERTSVRSGRDLERGAPVNDRGSSRRDEKFSSSEDDRRGGSRDRDYDRDTRDYDRRDREYDSHREYDRRDKEYYRDRDYPRRDLEYDERDGEYSRRDRLGIDAPGRRDRDLSSREGSTYSRESESDSDSRRGGDLDRNAVSRGSALRSDPARDSRIRRPSDNYEDTTTSRTSLSSGRSWQPKPRSGRGSDSSPPKRVVSAAEERTQTSKQALDSNGTSSNTSPYKFRVAGSAFSASRPDTVTGLHTPPPDRHEVNNSSKSDASAGSSKSLRETTV